MDSISVHRSILFLVTIIIVILGFISLTFVGGKLDIKELNISVQDGLQFNLKK